jgi:hypothetical protein
VVPAASRKQKQTLNSRLKSHKFDSLEAQQCKG